MHSGPLGPQSEDSKGDGGLLKDREVDRDEAASEFKRCLQEQ